MIITRHSDGRLREQEAGLVKAIAKQEKTIDTLQARIKAKGGRARCVAWGRFVSVCTMKLEITKRKLEAIQNLLLLNARIEEIIPRFNRGEIIVLQDPDDTLLQPIRNGWIRELKG